MKTIEAQLERIAMLLEQLETKAEKHAEEYVANGVTGNRRDLSYYPAAFGYTIGNTNMMAREIREILTQLK